MLLAASSFPGSDLVFTCEISKKQERKKSWMITQCFVYSTQIYLRLGICSGAVQCAYLQYHHLEFHLTDENSIVQT